MPVTSTVAWNGSAASRNGLLWAIRRESTHGGSVLLLAVIDGRFEPFGDTAVAELAAAAERALAAEVAWVHQAHPEVGIESRVVVGDRQRELIEGCPPGSMLVIGVEDRPERVKRWSFTARVAAASPAPVAVVPADGRERVSGVVVGCDGSEEAFAAVRVAVDEARHRVEPLHVVHAWPATGAVPESVAAAFEEEGEERRSEVEGWMARIRAEAPDVEAHGHVDPGPPAAALARRSRTASLLVVGSRGHGQTLQFVLGSVSRALVLGATGCPVVVVKD